MCPVNQPVEFRLRSHDVIHAFWIPAFAGKVDMIPGRTTRLTVHRFAWGDIACACAEYCGESHALMNFDVRVVSSSEFEKWLIHQASPAGGPADSSTIQAEDPAAVASPAAVTSAQSQPGHALFLATGCGACHTVRGTPAQGSVGPDLTHFGSRLSLGAGIFPVDHNSIVAWLRSTEHLKPAVHMPNFGDLQPEQLEQLATFLEQLK